MTKQYYITFLLCLSSESQWGYTILLRSCPVLTNGYEMGPLDVEDIPSVSI